MSQLPPISSLMSPPEAQPLDSFTTPTKPPHSPLDLSSYRLENTLAPMVSSRSPELPALISPPVSPWTNNLHKVEHKETKATDVLPDPVLYPSTELGDGAKITEPLFPSTPERMVAEEAIDKHMACHMMQFDKKLNRPTRDEYLLACSLVMTVGKAYNRNPGLYMKRTREETDEYYHKSKRICAHPGTTSTPPVRIAPKPSPAVRQPRKPAVPRKTTTPKPKPHTRVSRKPKASPMESTLGTPGSERLGTPESGARAAQKEKDYRFWMLPDYCPPLESLTNPKPLRNIDWNGKSSNPLDLSNDPDRHHLHEAELRAAEICRLTCAQYLTTKRRIFMARLQCYRNKKEFRRTDAQQACNIDVNKASGLWVAYSSVGWLDPVHMEKFL